MRLVSGGVDPVMDPLGFEGIEEAIYLGAVPSNRPYGSSKA